ncbi:hypothetical protein [Enterococcus sp. 3C8_DIV0646]|uniref:hypothetical protein n=1 Tax=Enterococcus sp. 3C8_DIV0646 TaxID=1834175 RepID=UPI000A3561DD|nr:hypothetical protein [Enterococcus sp. 3C8_DIV0646]OTO31578.1 hypothetical protein A5876_002194 [Enterococcus sp. 3C8_DIV0646]
MPVVKDEISLVKVANGDDGRGILGTPVATYAQSTSGTIPPTTWSATRPNVPAGQYLWTRVVTTYTDNTTSETQTPTLMGAEGESGLGIKDKSISYAVGTSGNTPPTSGWQETIPIVSANQYLWTKTTLVYTDESKTEAYSVGKMGANGADAKLLYLTASAENMAFNADDTPKTTQTINISAKLQNVTGTATFTAIPYIGNTAQTAITLGGTGNTRTLTSAQWTNKDWTLIAITATLDNLSDTVSIVKVKDGATGDKGDQGNQGIPGTPGADGKTPYTHWAYAWSADGKDRFTSSYPIENILIGTTSDTQTFTTNSGWPDKTGATNALMAVGADRLVKPGDTITYSAFITAPADVRAYIYVRLNRPGASNGSYEDKTSNRLDPGTSGWCSVMVTVPSDTTSLRFTVGRYENSNAVTRTLSWASEKAEKSDKRTIYTPSPADDFANAYPTYVGTYTDYEPTDSEDPSKYTWQRILGESGQDGKDGEDGANGQDAKEVISGYLSNDSIIVPANASGTVTDFTKALGDFIIYEGQTKVSSGVTYSKVSETGMTSTINSAGHYTVTALSADVGTATYQAVYKAVTIQKIMIVVKNKQGATGPAGSNGTNGKGIVSSATTYQPGTSGTTPPTGTWSISIPSISENQYLWTKIVLTYSDNTNSTAYSVGNMGAKGETGATGSTGATGATGNGIKSTTINFASSTSGTAAPSSGWTTSIPTVAAGSFLWTRTVLTFTDNTTNTSYTVAKQGEKGDPTGIISQSTVPTNPYVGMLWQNTGASGYIIGATYQWNGSKFNLYIFTADNIVATTLSAITANLGNITAGNISGVTISGSKFINSGTTTIDGNEMDYTTTLEGSYESEWKLKAINLNGRLIINPTILASSAWNDIAKNEPAWAWSVSNAGIYTARAGTRSNTSLSNNASYGPDGITMASELYASTYGNVYLSYLDLLTINPTLLSPTVEFETYSNAWIPTAKRTVGRVITLSGAFKNKVALNLADETVMGFVPEWAYPTQDINFRVNGSGINTFLLKIKSNGQITISRYGTTSMIDVPIGAWLNLSCVYSAS